MQSNDLPTEWGRRLARARQARGLSIGELARRTGIHKSHLARFEVGEAGLGDDNRVAVAAVVGQPTALLFPYPDTITKDDPCLSAAPVEAAASSATPATGAARPSPAPSAAGPDASDHSGSQGNE